MEWGTHGEKLGKDDPRYARIRRGSAWHLSNKCWIRRQAILQGVAPGTIERHIFYISHLIADCSRVAFDPIKGSARFRLREAEYGVLFDVQKRIPKKFLAPANVRSLEQFLGSPEGETVSTSVSQVIQRFISRQTNAHWGHERATREEWVSDSNIDKILDYLKTQIRHLTDWRIATWVATEQKSDAPAKPRYLWTSQEHQDDFATQSARRSYIRNDFAPLHLRSKYASVIKKILKTGRSLSTKKVFCDAVNDYFDNTLKLPCPITAMWDEWVRNGDELVNESHKIRGHKPGNMI